MDPQLAGMIRNLRNEVADLQAQINMTKIQGDIPASLPGQYPGKPIPTTEAVEVAIVTNTNQINGNITFASDGPFMAQRIHFAYRPTAGLTGQWRPLSTIEDQAGGVMVDALDFYWGYQSSGSFRRRQNLPVPSSCLTEMARGNGAWDLFVHDVFDPTATVTITITPTRAPTHAGILYIGFHGCYMLK